MNKVEFEGVLWTEPKVIGEGDTMRVLACVQTVDEKGFKTTFPFKAWRQVGEKLSKLHKGEQVHCIGKITRFKPQNNEAWVTDVEVKEIL